MDVCSICVKGAYRPRDVDPRTAPLTVLRKGGRPVLEERRRGGVGSRRRGLGTHVQDEGQQHRSRRHPDDRRFGRPRRRATSARSSSPTRASTSASAPTCSWSCWRRVRSSGTRIHAMVKSFQLACQRMKYASVPVVAAPYGMTLGGGLEVCLGAGNVQAAAETYAGLVEVGVGLVPGGGGTMNLLWRAFEGVPDGATVDPVCARDAGVQERRARARRDERRRGEGVRLLPAYGWGVVRSGAAAHRRQGARHRPRRKRAGAHQRRARTSFRARAGLRRSR